MLVFTAVSPLCAVGGAQGAVLSPVYTTVCLALLGGTIAGCVGKTPFALGEAGAERLLFALLCAEEVFLLPEWELLGYPAYEGFFKDLIAFGQVPVLTGAVAVAGYVLARLREKIGACPEGSGGRVALLAVAVGLGYAPRVMWLLLGPAAVRSVALCVGVAAGYAAAVVAIALRCNRVGLPMCRFACAYALGMLLWALLTRVYPVHEDAYVAAVPLAVCTVAAVAVGLMGRSGSGARSAQGSEPEVEGSIAQDNGLLEVLRAAGLTERELQLALLACDGKSSAQMASELGISASTVRVTLGKAYKKLGVGGLAELRDLVAAPVVEGTSTAAPDTAPAAVSADPERSSRLRQAATFVALLPLLPIAAGSGAWGQGQPLLLGVGLCLLGYGVLVLTASRGMGAGAEEKVRAASRALLAVATVSGIALTAAVLAGNLPVAYRTRLVASAFELPLALLYTGSVLALTNSKKKAAKSNPESADAAWPPSLVAASFLGAVLEELWRSTTSFSVLAPLVPFIAAVGFFAMRLVTRDVALIRRTAAAVGIALLLGVLGVIELWVPAALALVPVVFLLVGGADGRMFRTPLHGFALAVGILVGVFAVNRAEDIAVMGEFVPLLFDNVWQVKLAIQVIAALLSAPGIAAAYATYAHVRDLRSLVAAPTADERLRGFLVSRGLNELESQTALLIAQNKTTPQIAAELHYSAGMINTARRAAYAKLHVRSKAELAAAFAQFRAE